MSNSYILKDISRILLEARIKHYIDPEVKRFGGSNPYLGIFRHKRCLFFTHYYEDGYIQAITPKIMPPKKIKELFGIEGEDNWGDVYRSRAYYVLDIPLTTDKLNGKWTIQDKRDFFVTIATNR
jgi:hypothetical protein